MTKPDELTQIDKLIEQVKAITDDNRSQIQSNQEKSKDKIQPIPLLQSPPFIQPKTTSKK